MLVASCETWPQELGLPAAGGHGRAGAPLVLPAEQGRQQVGEDEAEPARVGRGVRGDARAGGAGDGVDELPQQHPHRVVRRHPRAEQPVRPVAVAVHQRPEHRLAAQLPPGVEPSRCRQVITAERHDSTPAPSPVAIPRASATTVGTTGDGRPHAG
ncbi:hypothetical protein AB0F42_10000 [Streptomyces buecherae]|uniref:hypothetical protein n=1 Tax=Streptomyces buecherae TaxID=2763006 RepID=UPI0033C83058